MMNNYRWGFVGTGWIADVLCADLNLVGIMPHGVSSRNLETAKSFAEPRGIELVFEGYKRLCESHDIDIVYVANPNPWHYEVAKTAIEHKKHVVVEKPFTMNARETEKLIKLAKENNVFLMEAMWSRFLPAQLSLLKAINDGEIGQVQAVVTEHSQNLPEESHSRLWDLSLGGGALLDLGIYPLALIENILGAPRKVYAIGRLAHTGADDLVQVGLSFEQGKVASMFTTQTVAGEANATIYGTQGRIEIRKPLWGQFEYDLFDKSSNLVRHYKEEIVGTGRQLQILAVNQAISEGKLEHPLIPLDQTLSLSKTMDEIRKQLGVVYAADLREV
jgi:predicted dehydrogenase